MDVAPFRYSEARVGPQDDPVGDGTDKEILSCALCKSGYEMEYAIGDHFLAFWYIFVVRQATVGVERECLFEITHESGMLDEYTSARFSLYEGDCTAGDDPVSSLDRDSGCAWVFWTNV